MKSITAEFDISVEQFYVFITLGLPATKVNGRWYAHYEKVGAWFKRLTDSTRPSGGKSTLRLNWYPVGVPSGSSPCNSHIGPETAGGLCGASPGFLPLGFDMGCI
jgi:hypothetical protein